MRTGMPRDSRLVRLGSASAMQAGPSIATLIGTIAIARVASPEGFGGFAISSIALTFGIVLGRSSGPEIYAMVGGGVSTQLGRPLAVLGAGSGLVVSCGLIAGSIVVAPPGRPYLMMMAAAAPVLVARDAVRLMLVLQQTYMLPVLADLLWIIGSVAAVAVSTTSDSGAEVAAIWLLGGVASFVFFVRGLASISPQTSVRMWVCGKWKYIATALTENLILLSGVQLPPLIIGGIAGTAAVGLVRGAYTAFGPLTTIVVGAFPALIALVSESRRADQTRRRIAELGGLVVAGTALWGVLLLLVPDPLGLALLGETWAAVRAALLPLTLFFSCSLLVSVLQAAVRGHDAWRHGLSAGVVTCVTTVGGAGIGAALSGADGGVWGMMLGAFAGTTAWAVALLRADDASNRRAHPGVTTEAEWAVEPSSGT